MESVLFPFDFFDFPAVADLPAEHKLVLAAAAAHHRVSAAAVLTVTPYVVRSLPLPDDAFLGVCGDLDRRGVVVFDLRTREVFVCAAFAWHRVPAADEDTPWARQVRAAVARIQSARVRTAVKVALETPPLARITSTKIPTNLLTALPPRGRGEAWVASEMLVAFALAANPEQTPAGVFRPNIAAVAALCSLPVATVAECISSLAVGGAVVYDADTGEIFVVARLRAASGRDELRIREAAEQICSPLIFRELLSAVRRLFPQIQLKTNSCAPVENKGVNARKGEGESPPRNDTAAATYRLRHGPWRAPDHATA